MANITIKIYQDELWWGGSVADGWKMPITKSSNYTLDTTVNYTYNQFNGLFVSTAGRYVFFEGGAKIIAKDGILSISDTIGEIDFQEGLCSLREAYLKVANKHFSKQNDIFDCKFAKPLYSTWLEMLSEPTEDKIIKYVASIANNCFDRSCLIIDDGWMKGYGDWDFDKKKFNSPCSMVDKIHDLGFSVMLWIVPFVDFDVPEFSLLEEKNALLRETNGKVASVKWWNGVSAVLDLTSPFAYDWIKNKLQYLKRTYHIDCFKFDAGDAMYYVAQNKEGMANLQSELWARLAIEYPGSELRACVGLGGELVMQRLSDKKSDWSEEGMGGLIGNVIQAGLLGYPYVCADMVGGGQSSDAEKLENADYEFLVRSCQVSALFPINQYSNAVWNKGEHLKKEVYKYCALRKKYEPYICKLLQDASRTFEPVVRPIVYNFPTYNGDNTESFMLGDKYLVSPVVKRGSIKKEVFLPADCEWKYNDKIFAGGQKVEIDAGLDVLPIFEKIG